MTTKTQYSNPNSTSLLPSPYRKGVLKSSIAFILGAASLAAMTATSNALLLTFDMRAVQQGVLPADQGAGATSPAWNVTNPHLPFIQDPLAAPNSRLVLQLWAVFNDPTPSGDAFQFTQGSVVSLGASGDFLLPGAATLRSTGVGNTANNVPGLDASTSRSGNPVEASASYGYTADGVLDIGDLATNSTVTSSPVQWFTADSGPTSLAVGATNELLIGEFVLTLGANTHSGNIGFVYQMRPRSSGAVTLTRIQKFTIDATVYSLNYLGAGTANGAAFNDAGAFQSTIVGVPEPSAFGMVLLGSMGLLGFRRFGLKKAQ